MFDIPPMHPNLSERISSRLKELGKNPSSVALQAGLGRSSVRDIIANPDSNPRIDTLRKLTGPLECSLDYLTGASAEPGEKPTDADSQADPLISREVNEVGLLEEGVFRSAGDGPLKIIKTTEKILVYGDRRRPGWILSLYRIEDDSLIHEHILRGDILTVARPPNNEIIPLVNGSLVVVSRTLRQQVDSETTVTEFTAKFLEESPKGGFILTNRSKRSRDVRIAHTPAGSTLEEFEETMPNLYLSRATPILIAGVVVRITRTMPV
jgi:transcriptional regulator with XRE-family HTH domain